MKKHLWIPCVLLAAAVALLLILHVFHNRHPGNEHFPELTAEQREELSAVTELHAVLREEELSQLERYPNLLLADLSGSSCYAAMDAFAALHPQIQVRYTLPLGAVSCWNDETLLSLRDEQIDPALLLQALPHLKKLELLELRRTALPADTLETIGAAVSGDTEFRYTRQFLEWELPCETTYLDLSILDMETLASGLDALASLPELDTLQLMCEDGSSPYTLAEASRIQEALPGVFLDYRFELFGKVVSTADEELRYLDQHIGDEGLPQIRQALSIMPHCRQLTLDDCYTSNEAMDQLRTEFQGRAKIVWRVHYGLFSDLTDTRIVHAVADEHGTWLNDEMCQVLRYCVETEYMDLGHNSLHSIEFCRYMPHLKMAILSYNQISDLSPLADHQELVFLELFCCRYLDDLSPLASCPNLKMLNISFSTATDITPLYSLSSLELFHAARTDVPSEQIQVLAERIPDCRITFEGEDIHEVGWRKVREGEYYEWYLEIREIFGYGDPESYSHKRR